MFQLGANSCMEFGPHDAARAATWGEIKYLQHGYSWSPLTRCKIVLSSGQSNHF
jgi:hypothetical protein